MSAKKSVFVTAMMAAMLTVIVFCLLGLGYKVAFFIIVGVFAVIGMSASAITLCEWLMEPAQKEVSSETVAEPEETPEEVPEEVTATIEEIMEESRA